MPPKPRHFSERFWSKVRKTETCWIWTGCKTAFGYGQLRTARHAGWQAEYAHRLSYEMAYGECPPYLNVLHHCDNPACVRPDHLFLGTQTVNTRDMASKGRSKNTRLTPDEAKEIRHLYNRGAFQRELADIFGVAQTTISYVIKTGWKWLA